MDHLLYLPFIIRGGEGFVNGKTARFTMYIRKDYIGKNSFSIL